MSRYILAVDQSTQGTKGLLFDDQGVLVGRADRPHRQIVNDQGWISHDPAEIRKNTLEVCKDVIEKVGAKTGICKGDIVALGISNQRETTVAWNRKTGEPLCDAIVWQCARAAQLCEQHSDLSETVQQHTGIKLSPYFPAAKMGWIMANIPEAETLAQAGELALGSVDSWLLSFLCAGAPHKTDYSNASRTQLFDIRTLQWDSEICEAFHIPQSALPEVCMSDSCFGMTDLGGYLDAPIPVHGVLGDSHAALFGQDCRESGKLKVTYGTGSSVMMNIGAQPRFSDHGLVTSIAWGIGGSVDYVLEGNLNYTGAVMTWLKQDVRLIQSDMEATEMAYSANPKDRAYFVPAFTGLGAPYWNSRATGLLTGITRTTGRNEIAKACLDCIAYQITDLTTLMDNEIDVPLQSIRVDGGPTASKYLMQFQSSIANVAVQVPDLQELSGMGAAYIAGSAVGLYNLDQIYKHICYEVYTPDMDSALRETLYQGWKNAISMTLSNSLNI